MIETAKKLEKLTKENDESNTSIASYGGLNTSSVIQQ
jgi:hypothetical protein